VLQRALKEIIACFLSTEPISMRAHRPRARIGGTSIGPSQRRGGTICQLIQACSILRALLTFSLIAKPRSGFSRAAVIRVAMKVQQYTGPVTAKGVEDTAFYRYGRLIALNEVGGHPGEFRVCRGLFLLTAVGKRGARQREPALRCPRA
jgi:(1->4)-alpha-D-glucan 1-alpha-D-glucosylmutase